MSARLLWFRPSHAPQARAGRFRATRERVGRASHVVTLRKTSEQNYWRTATKKRDEPAHVTEAQRHPVVSGPNAIGRRPTSPRDLRTVLLGSPKAVHRLGSGV